jgi:hypothetical protein
MSSANPAFHDAIDEIGRVRHRCSSVSRATLGWSFWCYDLNLLAFSLVTRSLAFSITLVISEFDVTNCPLSYIRDRPQIQFFVCNMQPSRDLVSLPHEAPNPSLSKVGLQPCTLQVLVYAFILLLSSMASKVVCSCWKVFHSFGVMKPNGFNDEIPG